MMVQKKVKIRVPLKYLSNFWRTLEMPLINYEINLILTWSARCFITDAQVDSQEPRFTITDTKLYVPVVTLYLDFLINPSFQGVNRPFILSFQNTDDRTSYMRYYVPLVEIKDYNVVIDG